LRLENLEGRAAPGALGVDHIGEEIPQTGVGIQADTTMIQPGHGGEVYTGVGGVDPSASKPTGTGDFGVSIDPSASKPSGGGDISF